MDKRRLLTAVVGGGFKVAKRLLSKRAQTAQSRVERTRSGVQTAPAARRPRLAKKRFRPGGPERPEPRGQRKNPMLPMEQAVRERHRDVWVRFRGPVVHLLPDDLVGDRHQRFLMETIDSPDAVLVSHNIDLAQRVPIRVGDVIEVEGEYVWNDKGGFVHWTHHDPGGHFPGGWIEYGKRRYD